MKPKLKPVLRPDAKADMRAALDNVLTGMMEDHNPIYRSCLNCINFRELQNETCALATPPQKPPARIIAYGCNQWEDLDTIPF